MIRACLSVALVGVLLGCAKSPAAKGPVIVKCYGIENFGSASGDSWLDKACRAKIRSACPGAFYIVDHTIDGLTHTFKVGCE